MKRIVLYFTKYGSTKKYSETIAEKLQCECVSISTFDLEKLKDYEGQETADRIALGM